MKPKEERMGGKKGEFSSFMTTILFQGQDFLWNHNCKRAFSINMRREAQRGGGAAGKSIHVFDEQPL